MKVRTEDVVKALENNIDVLKQNTDKYGCLILLLKSAKDEITKLSTESQSMKALLRKRHRQHESRKQTLKSLTKDVSK